MCKIVYCRTIQAKYNEKLEDELNTEGEGRIRRCPTRQRGKPEFFLIENFEFSGIDNFYTIRTTLTNHTEALASWGCRIHRLLLCEGVRLPQRVS